MSHHLKRLASPRVWSFPRKTHVWAIRPDPGPHALKSSVTLTHVIRDQLKHCETTREARHIIGSRKVHVDGIPAPRYKRPVGFMDVISLPSLKTHYRMLLDTRGKLRPTKITSDQAKWKLIRVRGIQTVKGGALQIHGHDGRNILVEKNAFKSGSSLKISLPDQKIIENYPLEKGNKAMIIGGKHTGDIATINSYEITLSSRPNIVTFEEGYSTIRDHVFIVGKETSEVAPPVSVTQ